MLSIFELVWAENGEFRYYFTMDQDPCQQTIKAIGYPLSPCIRRLFRDHSSGSYTWTFWFTVA